MKKTLFMILALSLVSMCFSSCGKTTVSDSETTQESQVQENSIASVESPVALLTNVWDTYTEEEKFPVAGGDFSEENNNPNGAGRYSVDDADSLDSTLCFPSASASKLEDAASLVHMMNLNTFTSAVFRVNLGEDVNAVADELAENVRTRQWMCGIPDKFEIYILGNDIIFILGENDLINTFSDKLTTVYPDVSEYMNENITTG